jgi:translation elongation factor EF-4
MTNTYQIKADDINFDFFQNIKNTYKGKDIEISVDVYEKTKENNNNLRNIEILLKRIKDVEAGKNLIVFSPEEFEKIS